MEKGSLHKNVYTLAYWEKYCDLQKKATWHVRVVNEIWEPKRKKMENAYPWLKSSVDRYNVKKKLNNCIENCNKETGYNFDPGWGNVGSGYQDAP